MPCLSVDQMSHTRAGNSGQLVNNQSSISACHQHRVETYIEGNVSAALDGSRSEDLLRSEDRMAEAGSIRVFFDGTEDAATSIPSFHSPVDSPVQPRIKRKTSEDSNKALRRLSMQLTKLQKKWPLQIDNSRIEQSQMLSDFLEMHFPTPEAKANLAYRRSYLTGLPEVDLSSTPMLRNAVQAICFAHAGSNHKDDRLIVRHLEG